MKRSLALLTTLVLISTILFADGDHEHKFLKLNDNSYGFELPDASKAIDVKNLFKKMGDKDEYSATVKGKITEVCQSAGCWIKVYKDDENSVLVKFKDHFAIPKDLAGKTATFVGVANKKVYTVDELKHFAEDAGKSQEEIDKITEEKSNIFFYASGVTID